MTAIILALLSLLGLAAAEPSRWEAMVINLDRRPDRLQNFTRAVQKSEPWLLDGRHLCRVVGRDGRTLPRDARVGGDPSKLKDDLNALRAFIRGGKTRTELRNEVAGAGAPRASEADGGVPTSLSDTGLLLNAGWVSREALREATHDQEWPMMTAGGVGLYLGHAAAWRHVVERNLDYGLIFEDDLTLFAHNFHDQVLGILGSSGASPTPKWDLLYLQRCNDEDWKKERVAGPDVHPARHEADRSQEIAVGDQELVTCTGAYIVTRTGAQKLLRGALPAAEQLDSQLASVPGLKRAALSPPVAQCQEIRINGAWRTRDTDVQQPRSAKVGLLDASAGPDRGRGGASGAQTLLLRHHADAGRRFHRAPVHWAPPKEPAKSPSGTTVTPADLRIPDCGP